MLKLQKHSKRIQSIVCVTAQHREMLDPVLDWFQIAPDYVLDLMRPAQGLAEFASRAVLDVVRPDVVLVQGDTTTVMAAAAGERIVSILLSRC